MSDRVAGRPASELLEHADFLRRLARRLLHDEHGAEDVVQQAFVVAVESGHRRRGPLRGWLAGVVRNLALMARRRRGRRAERERRAARGEPTAATLDAVSRMEIARKVVDAVASLEERYRTVVVLRFYDDLTSAEIAARLGCPAATVRTRLRRGLAVLRDRLDREHGDSRRAWGMALLPLVTSRSQVAATAATVVGGVLMKKVTAILAVLILLLLGTVVVVSLSATNDAPGSVTRDERASGERADPGAGTSGEAGARSELAGVSGDRVESPLPLDGVESAHPSDDIAEVVLTGPDGTPVAGAEVVLYEDTPGRRLGFDMPPVRASGRTDVNGSVLLSITSSRRHMLKISHGDFPTLVDVECFGGNVTRVAMPAPGVFLGVVTDSVTGRPVVGAEVTVMDFAMCGLLHFWRVETDGQGRYRVDGIGPGLLNMWARHPDYAEGFPDVVARAVPGEETVLNFSLDRGVRLTLRVTDSESRRTLPDVEVVWNRDPVARGRGDTLVTQAVSRTRGFLELRAEGYLLEVIDYLDRGEARLEDPREVVMTRGIPVRGSVLLGDGSPAQGVPVRLQFTRRGQDAENWRETRSDSMGEFVVLGADPGGTLRGEIDLPAGGLLAIPAVIVAGDATEVVLDPVVLTPKVTVRGQLLDPLGRPVARAKIHAFSDDGQFRPLADCFLDPRGRFRLAGLPPGPLLFQARYINGWAAQTCRIEAHEDTDLAWKLDPGLDISGVVLREDGSPVAPMNVLIGRRGCELTDEKGRFHVRGLGPGPHHVRLANRPEICVKDVPGGTHNVRLIIPR